MESARYDFHIHTKYLKCANETMEILAIVAKCKRLGMTALAITDHMKDMETLTLHSDILRDIEQIDTEIDVYFGVELNFTGCDEGFLWDEEIRDKIGFQFAIGGIHSPYAVGEYDVKKVVDVQHRHHLKTCADPLVAVLVHPYWFSMNEYRRNDWPWFGTMDAVPQSYARELGQAAKETNTAIEINGNGNVTVNAAHDEAFIDQYFDYLSAIAEEGAMFTPGSDAHDISRVRSVQDSWRMIERLNLPPERIWRPDCEPIVGRSRSAT